MTASLILAIDDQEDNLALLRAFLGARGYATVTALDGPTGLAIALERRPALILLDLSMPVMDGFEVLRRLRAERATARVPVIVLTAAGRDAALIERALELGATEYLSKPIQMDELGVRIRSALRLAATEQELDRLRRDFASMLVHDMRAPLDGVRLALGVLRRQAVAGTPGEDLLETAIGAIADLDGLVDGLLHANRLEDEGFRAELGTLPLAPLLARRVAAARPLALAKGLALELAAPPDGLAVRADAALMARVVDNLVGNAIKFTDAGTVAVGVEAAGDAVSLTVRDSGPGVPDAMKPRIFDRYFHVARRRETREGGFGLGLAFCEQALAAMGGAIEVADAPGGGAAFTIRLPRA